MSSSIEEQFQPPEWATKEEVIKAAQHYINYWKIEARSRNQQWLDAMDEIAHLKDEVERLGAFRTHTIIPNEILKAEVERLRKSAEISPPQSPHE